jgi:hypothetical protein
MFQLFGFRSFLRKQPPLTFVVVFIILLWTIIVVRFAQTSTISSTPSTLLSLRPRGVQILNPQLTTKINKGKPAFERQTNIINVEKSNDVVSAVLPFVDGFENPNGLPKLPRLGPESFFEILAPPYYGKSPVDGTRMYSPGSIIRNEYRTQCPVDKIDSKSVNNVDIPKELRETLEKIRATTAADTSSAPPLWIGLDTLLCSFGPNEYLPSTFNVIAEGAEDGIEKFKTLPSYSAYEFHQVCLTLNVDSSKKVQRGLIYFDPKNSHDKRCVPCPNPIEIQTWGDHACGLMWSHQINAQGTLRDFRNCYLENLKFITQIGQRQFPAKDLHGGIYYSNPILTLSYAYKNPGHQMYDSIFTLIPLIVNRDKLSPHLKVIVQQNPMCPETEWFCAVLRKIGFITNDNLLPTTSGVADCFESLIVPKWGLSRTVPFSPKLLEDFRMVLFKSFGFPSHEQNDKRGGVSKPKLLLYAHSTKSDEVQKHRRIWLDMKRTVAENAEVHEKFDVLVVDDFAALSVQKQAEVFQQADIVIMPHGGQLGNAMFSNPRTIIIELSCNGYSHLGMTNGNEQLFGSIPKALGFVHLSIVPCSCLERGEGDSNFSFGPQSLMQLVEISKKLAMGTHLTSMVSGKKCFGSER